MDMDWYSWLSKTGMEPTLVYEYSLILSRNELEESDIAHFNHEFLQSMGISIAKHRLEILKHARKVTTPSRARPISKLLVAIKQTKRCLAKYIHNFSQREDSALVLVPRDLKCKGSMAKRSKSLVMSRQGRSLLKKGKVTSFSGPIVHDHYKHYADHDDGSCSLSGVEETGWDTMFRNLKPN
ncbi:SAM domain-containing protein [Heracleum sosnowskyi]|uniref:SAM domain-containing protein n=1 Tax=Heracleum sosnowskyi TaxID=360622 RepID=A0AAD8M3F2_9APIA|nr:SAM domain-containing protein [Heracleum sosnowskyi]KAK1358189.1 SAM domain-containing protein [Heracleum sosnowskyi]